MPHPSHAGTPLCNSQARRIGLYAFDHLRPVITPAQTRSTVSRYLSRACAYSAKRSPQRIAQSPVLEGTFFASEQTDLSQGLMPGTQKLRLGARFFEAYIKQLLHETVLCNVFAITYGGGPCRHVRPKGNRQKNGAVREAISRTHRRYPLLYVQHAITFGHHKRQ